MSTPSSSPVPEQPPASNPELSDQQISQATEVATVSGDEELRQLVAEIIKASSLGFDPAQIRKGTVTAISATTTPPTLTLNMSGDTTVAVSGVRWLDSYAPVVNDTVLVGKQGTEIFVLGKIASVGAIGSGGGSGWTQATLGSGFSHNGNSQGNVEYRKVWDNGSWKMQWRGAAGRTSGTGVITSALATEFRPAVTRKLLAARGFGGGSVAIQLVFNTSGTVDTQGGAFTIASGTHTHSGPSHSHTNSSTNSTSGPGHSHSHGGTASPTSFSETHSHSMNSTGSGGTGSTGSGGGDVDVTDTDWISFHGIEYFL